MTLNESIRDWINHKIGEFDSLDGIQILTMGETIDQDPPMIGIMESSPPEQFQQGEVILYGVMTYEIRVTLETVPVSESDGGTSKEDHEIMRRDLYDIIGNRDALQFIENRNGFQVVDIRTTGPTTSAEEGRLISSWTISLVAFPN